MRILDLGLVFEPVYEQVDFQLVESIENTTIEDLFDWGLMIAD